MSQDNRPKPGTLEYFRDECAEFLKQMGFKPFWQGNRGILAKKGIAVQYLALKLPPEQSEKAVTLFQMVMGEYTRRCAMLGYDL